MAEDVLISEDGHVSKKGKGKGKRSKSVEKHIFEESSEKIPEISVKQQTKAKFDVLLKQALEHSTNNTGKKKKEKKKENETMLESLKAGEGLKKEKDEAIIANTYTPGDSPKMDKTLKDKGNLTVGDNLKYEDETVVNKKGKKKKRLTGQNNGEDHEQVGAVDTLTTNTSEHSDLSTKSNRVEKTSTQKKVKKKVVLDTGSEEDVMEMNELKATKDDSPETKSTDGEDKPQLDKNKSKKKKSKKKESVIDEETKPVAEEEETHSPLQDEGDVLGIQIHSTDKLEDSFYVLHPLVRIHIVDESNGLYLMKQNNDRSVTYYYEQTNNKISYILPIMTQPFDFKKHKSTIPVWEELLLINENFNYFLSRKPKCIIFFEVLDFFSMNTTSLRLNSNKHNGGWNHIAWAFLKPMGAAGKVNIDKRVRLQLFKPPTKVNCEPGKVEVYEWWSKAHTYNLYPSTLYVTLKRTKPSKQLQPAVRSMFATQQEISNSGLDDISQQNCFKNSMAKKDESSRKPAVWSRLAGQVCKIPNTLLVKLSVGHNGCFVLKFSHNGRYIACACRDGDNYPIYVYEIPAGVLIGEYSGHFGIIYDICWSNCDSFLLTSSSDGTVRQWNVQVLNSAAEKVLPHPCFVYTSQFHPKLSSIIVSGGYDQVIRVWNTEHSDVHGQLLQEIDHHRGHVNSLCFDIDGSRLYTSDSVGVIAIWNVFVSQQLSQKGFLRDWTLHHVIEDIDLKGVLINHISMDPGGRKLLVHCRDNFIRMVDLRINRVSKKYIGSMNFRGKLRSCISPCGTFVFSGSEDCMAYVWNADTADQVAVYEDLNYSHPITDVDYHPRDHIVAFSSLGDGQPVLIYRYDPQVAALGVGFPVQPIQPQKADVSMEYMQKSVPESSLTMGSLRIQKAIQKLDSVTLSTKPLTATDLRPLGVPYLPKPQQLTTLSPYGSAFDPTASLSPRFLANPESFSPHAHQTISSVMHQEQFRSYQLYNQQADGWRPTFGSVNRNVSFGLSPRGRPAHIVMNTDGGKAKFSFNSSPTKICEVIALYDYKAQRSDELTLIRGDILKVLYKDNENWWMGELDDGQQGFFPANYVIYKGEGEENNTNDNSATSNMEDFLKSYSDSLEKSEMNGDDTRTKTTTALNSKNGELKYLTATDESEEELLFSTNSHLQKIGQGDVPDSRRSSLNPLPTLQPRSRKVIDR